jgi:hypothetical protein
MATYTIDFLGAPSETVTVDPLGLVDQAPSPIPGSHYTTYKYDNKTVMDASTTAETIAITISAPAGGSINEQAATIDLATGVSKKSTLAWSQPSSTIRVDVTAQMTNTVVDFIRAGDRPATKMRLTAKTPP